MLENSGELLQCGCTQLPMQMLAKIRASRSSLLNTRAVVKEIPMAVHGWQERVRSAILGGASKLGHFARPSASLIIGVCASSRCLILFT